MGEAKTSHTQIQAGVVRVNAGGYHVFERVPRGVFVPAFAGMRTHP
jgi:hypothetical protein